MWKQNSIKVIKSPGIYDDEMEMSLETSLEPLWKLSWYSRLLFDWYRPMPKQNRPAIVIRCATITISIFCLTFYVLVYAHHLITTAWRMVSVHEIMPFFVLFVPVLMALLEMIDYLIRRNKYSRFYTKWSQFEKEINFTAFIRVKDRRSIKKIRYALYGFYTLLFVGNIVFIAYLTLYRVQSTDVNEQQNFVFISDHPELRKIIPFPTLESIQLVALALTIYFMTLTDLVSTFVYFHASAIVQTLKRNIDSVVPIYNSFSEIHREYSIFLKPKTVSVGKARHFVKEIHKIWSRYEKLRGLVAKADALFGPTIILNHGTVLLLCCITGYAVLRNFSLFMTNPDQIIYGSSLTIFSLRFVLILLLTNTLGSSARALRISAVHLQSHYWFSLQPSDHNVLQKFIKQLELDSLAACPYDFYRITPTILLHVSTLIISYIIVLLQSK